MKRQFSGAELWLFFDFSALLTRAISMGILPLARALKNRKIADSKPPAIYETLH